MSDAKTNWVDFRQVKAAVTMRMVLDHYRITGLRKSGQEGIAQIRNSHCENVMTVFQKPLTVPAI